MTIPYIAIMTKSSVKVHRVSDGSVVRSIDMNPYKGPKAVNVSGDVLCVTCGDGRGRVYSISSGTLQRVV